jgi:hypothetical protein
MPGSVAPCAVARIGRPLAVDWNHLQGEQGRAFRGAYAALLTPQKNGSGPFTIPLTFVRQAWYCRKKPVGA